MALAKRIIPCLDVDKGRVVKGVNFVDIRDAGDPVEVARRYNEQGADEITFLDITASHESRDTTYDTVERMAAQVFIPLTVGGGVRTVDDIRKLLNAFDQLVEHGHSVLIVEHNLDVIKYADHVIDLGPDGGAEGGEVVVTGTPEEVAAHPTSHTGRFLKEVV